MESPTAMYAMIGVVCLLIVPCVWFCGSNTSLPPLPPGPQPVPLLGNFRDLTSKEFWLPVTKWAKQYGDVIYLHVPGRKLVFLSSPAGAFDLLDKRGSIYSDKPLLTMSRELCGCKNMLIFMPYGEQMKLHRKMMHKALGPPAIPTYYPLIMSETQGFLRRLVASPMDFKAHTRRYAGGLTLALVYGYTPAEKEDPFLNLAEHCADLMTNKVAPLGGVWLVDTIPALQYLPTWIPGTGFKVKAAKWKAKIEELVDKPYEYMLKNRESGSQKPSFCSTILEGSNDMTAEFECDLKWAANTMYFGSVDTTITTVCHFLLAMMHYPEVLAKARQEIDSVVGTDRLPTFADRSSLPYVEAVFKETWRWGVPAPLSAPHCLSQDDVYNGMLIPKGSLVFANIWAIFRNEQMYPNPDVFYPERFLEKAEPETVRYQDPQNYVFGFGRRICPGMHLVDSSIWLLIVSMIATLDISKVMDEFGNVVEPKVEINNSTFRNPDLFKCDIRVRSQQALNLINADL